MAERHSKKNTKMVGIWSNDLKMETFYNNAFENYIFFVDWKMLMYELTR